VYWQEEKPDTRASTPRTMTDVVYGTECRALPVDHAWALSRAVIEALPWLPEDPRAGVHTIHVAESGNGWMRPGNPDDLLYLSRRTRLALRVPLARLDDARALTGRALDVAGHRLVVGEAAERPLSELTTLFSRYVVAGETESEETFLAAMHAALRAMGIAPRKMLCGIEHRIRTPDGPVRTRSLMLADLAPEESLRLQEQGLGPARNLGCGLFIPHKGIKELHPVLE
jgi:CRISPR-associated protein Cas6